MEIQLNGFNSYNSLHYALNTLVTIGSALGCEFRTVTLVSPRGQNTACDSRKEQREYQLPNKPQV